MIHACMYNLLYRYWTSKNLKHTIIPHLIKEPFLNKTQKKNNI